MHNGVPKRPIILIVEDEFLLRMDAVDMVRNAGFDAVEASNADEAIAILEANLHIHVVFTDIQMPGSMDGKIAGRPSRSLQHLAGSGSAKTTCRKAGAFCRNLTPRLRSSAHCVT